MKADDYNEKNNILRKAVERKIHTAVLIFLIIGWGIVGVACICDLCKDIYTGQEVIKDFITGKNNDLYDNIRELKNKLLNDMDTYRDLVMTLNTILTAVVIFYYSVQESRRGGIPHRTILAYTIGSFTIPVLFVNTLVLLPLCYIAGSFSWNWTACLCISFIYIMQMVIMISILASTSFQFSVYAIRKAETRQFLMLDKIEDQNELLKKEGIFKAKAECNPTYIWTYMRHHLVDVIVSTELSVDKLLIAEKILRVPYYLKKNELSEKKLKCNKIKKLYEFYYENVLRAFKRLDQPKESEFRNEMYLILYDFLEELSNTYKSLIAREGEIEAVKNNYLITVSGITNAVLYSNVDESEAFCNYVLNNIICETAWNQQISLYILFQEYLFRTNETAIRLANINSLENIVRWTNDVAQNQQLYETFWSVWIEYTTILPNVAWRYFYEAIRALDGKGNITSPVAYATRLLSER